MARVKTTGSCVVALVASVTYVVAWETLVPHDATPETLGPRFMV